LSDVKDPTLLDSRLTDGGKNRPRFAPQKHCFSASGTLRRSDVTNTLCVYFTCVTRNTKTDGCDKHIVCLFYVRDAKH
jgi:hypothetical protein